MPTAGATAAFELATAPGTTSLARQMEDKNVRGYGNLIDGYRRFRAQQSVETQTQW